MYGAQDAVIASGGRTVCRQGWCLRAVLDVTLALLDYVVTGDLTEHALCAVLAQRFQASAAGHIVLQPASSSATITFWSPPGDVTDLKDALSCLPQTFPLLLHKLATERRPTCLSVEVDTATWQGAVATRLMHEVLDCADIAQVPLNPNGSTARAVVLVSPRVFDRRDLHVFDCLGEPIAAWSRLVEGTPAPTLGNRLPDGDRETVLTTRETEILSLVAEGLLATTIAGRLDVSSRTVHKHLENIYRKLHAHDRLIAVKRAESLGLLADRLPARHRKDSVVLTLAW